MRKVLTLVISGLILAACQNTSNTETSKVSEAKTVGEQLITQQWHTLTLSFEGPDTSETDELNPFTDYRLQVEFTHPQSQYRVRGFYAADGNAGQTSADSGKIWQVRFSPDRLGQWEYSATLRKGKDIAIELAPEAGSKVSLKQASGQFLVTKSDKTGSDFKSKGRLLTDKGYFKFLHSDKYWIKGGPNSPENFLAFKDFDGTYRVTAEAREGEAAPVGEIHSYPDHRKDWQAGDPTWKDGKGKNIIGAINYLNSVGMNTVYFLTFNVIGDGYDVWPHISATDFERFDVSKLDQWEIVFSHMQAKGVLLHVVTQERENELLFDDGETGRLRKLYYSELIARFAHHPALVWNLGEENGPAHWDPTGQNDQQRKDMTSFLTQADPYNHPILLHTHSEEEPKEHLLPPLLGFKPLDGLSFQVDDRERVYKELAHWRKEAHEAGNDWLITMDEIGMWMHGALNDFEDPNHDSLRRHVLWGSLLAGGAGVEWYFGAKHPNNDLTSEDWRHRHNLWLQTKYALDFFTDYLPYWEMLPAQELINDKRAYALAKPGEIYAVYLMDSRPVNIDLSGEKGEFELHWFDPKNGGELVTTDIKNVKSGSVQALNPPIEGGIIDWVALLRRKK